MINITELAPLEQRKQLQKLLGLDGYDFHDLIIKLYMLEGLDEMFVFEELPTEVQNRLLNAIKNAWLDTEYHLDELINGVNNAYQANELIKDIIQQLEMTTDWFTDRWCE